LLTLGGFVFIALAINKFIPFALIFSGALLSLFWGRERESIAKERGLAEAMALLISQIRDSSPVVKCIVAVVLFASSLMQFYQSFKRPVADHIVAVEAMDFFETNGLPVPLLNTFGDGGYVMYRFSDPFGQTGYKVPIDGRTNITPREVQLAHHAAFSGYVNWQDYLDLVKPVSVLWRTASPLTALLLAKNEWCLVYQSTDKERGHSLFISQSIWLESYSHLESNNCNKF